MSPLEKRTLEAHPRDSLRADDEWADARVAGDFHTTRAAGLTDIGRWGREGPDIAFL